MSESSSDISFCDGCHLRGRIITDEQGGSYCPRTGLDNMSMFISQMAGSRAINLGVSEPTTPIEELGISMGSEFMLRILQCIDSMKAGKGPVLEG